MSLSLVTGSLWFASAYAANKFFAPPPPTCATVDQLMTKMGDMSKQIDNLNRAINEFASKADVGTLVEALDIQNGGYAVRTAVDNATNIVKAVNPNPMSDDDAKKIYEMMVGFETTMREGMSALKEKKPQVMSLPPEVVFVIGSPNSMLSHGILRLLQSFERFDAAWIPTVPSSIVGEVQAVTKLIESNYQDALDYFQTA